MFRASRYPTPYKICRHYIKGLCTFNDQCNFLHVDTATTFDALKSTDHDTADTTTDTADTTTDTDDTAYVYTIYASSVYADTVYSDDAYAMDNLNDVTYKQKVQSCWHFLLKGACLRGDECKFLHELPDPQDIVKSPYHCRHFLRGNCKQGKNCTFVHDPTKIVAIKSSYLCKHFANGWCKRGDGCKFMHESLHTNVSYENQCVRAPASVQMYASANTGLQFGVPVHVVFLSHIAQVVTFS